MRFVVTKQQFDKIRDKVKLGYQHKVEIMDINEISERIIGKEVVNVDVTYGEDTLTIYFNDGSVLELIVDSIYYDSIDYDD
jgi:hypothetical protein